MATQTQATLNKVWIDLDLDLKGRAIQRMAFDLLNELGIETDSWGRRAAQITDEQLARIRAFEEEHSDKPESYDEIYESGSRPFQCCIASEMSDEAFANAHVTRVCIKNNSYKDSWQR